MRADLAWLRVSAVRKRLSGPRVWAIFRRSLTGPTETCATRQSGSLHARWPIYLIFEEAKGQVGMDHYETRIGVGWHHYMAQPFFAHHFLMQVRAQLRKSPALTTAQVRQLVAQIIDTDKCRSGVGSTFWFTLPIARAV